MIAVDIIVLGMAIFSQSMSVGLGDVAATSWGSVCDVASEMGGGGSD